MFELLEPGGVFANLEHLASPSERLHRRFYQAIGYPDDWEDPSNKLLDVETQLHWLRELGFEDVDCYWKWLEMALLIGVKTGRAVIRAACRMTSNGHRIVPPPFSPGFFEAAVPPVDRARPPCADSGARCLSGAHGGANLRGR